MKKINPIVGFMATARELVFPTQDRENVIRFAKDNWIVDTCIAFDTQMWETGISQDKGEKWIIVEQYETREEAEKGHNKWLESMNQNPEQKLEDIGLWDG